MFSKESSIIITAGTLGTTTGIIITIALISGANFAQPDSASRGGLAEQARLFALKLDRARSAFCRRTHCALPTEREN